MSSVTKVDEAAGLSPSPAVWKAFSSTALLLLRMALCPDSARAGRHSHSSRPSMTVERLCDSMNEREVDCFACGPEQMLFGNSILQIEPAEQHP